MGHTRLHRAVDTGCDGPLVLPDDRPDVCGAENRQVGAQAIDLRLDQSLVSRVLVAVKQGDDDRFGASCFCLLERRGDRCRIRNDFRHAIGVDAFQQGNHPVSRDERNRPAREQVVGIGYLEASQFEHVTETRGDDEPELGALALDDAVHADSRAVGEVADLRRRDAEALLDLVQPLKHLGSRRIGTRQNLECPQIQRRLVQHAEIGEGAADIDADAIAHRSAPAAVD